MSKPKLHDQIMNVEDKLNAVNARLAERMTALDRRLSVHFGTGASPVSAVRVSGANDSAFRAAAAKIPPARDIFDVLQLQENPWVSGDFMAALQELKRKLSGLGIDPDTLVNPLEMTIMPGSAPGMGAYLQLMDFLMKMRTSAGSSLGTARRSGVCYGIFAGVNHSPGNPALQGCANDANDLRNTCAELGAWQRGNTVVLEDATCAQFEDGIGKIARAAKSGDAVLVSFSGHGGASGSNPDDDFVFCMGDGSLSEKRFRRALSAFHPGVRVVVVVDACQSDAAATGTSFGQSLLPNVGWITASASWQNSDDGFQGKRRNGFLTGALLEGWRNGGAAGMAAQAKASFPSGVRQQSVVSPDTLNFLDLAVFVAHSWRYWHPTCQQPQYHNPAILESVSAGRIGATAVDSVDIPDGRSRVGFPKSVHHYYCDKCGHEWYSDGWDSHCPKFGCTGNVREM